MKNKKTLTSNKNIKKARGKANSSALFIVAALAIVTTFGSVLVGGALPQTTTLKNPTLPADPYSCCDTGNGTDCHPILENQITYNGDQYALLKSKIYQNEPIHMQPTNTYTPDGHLIFINT